MWIWVFFIYNTSFVSPLLLQLVLVHTLDLTRKLVWRRNNITRKRVHFKHHLKEWFQKHGLLMWKDSQHDTPACAINGTQCLAPGLGSPMPPSPAPSIGIMSRERYQNRARFIECESRNCVLLHLRDTRREAAALQTSQKNCGVDAKAAVCGVKAQGPSTAPQNSLVCQSTHGKQPVFPISPGRAHTSTEIGAGAFAEVGRRLCLQITVWAIGQMACAIKVIWAGAHKSQTGQRYLWGCYCGPHNLD